MRYSRRPQQGRRGVVDESKKRKTLPRVQDAIRGLAAEVTHGVEYLRNGARGNLYRSPHIQEGPASAPVVLLHGFLGTRGVMYNFERRLAREGVPVFSFSFGNLNTRDIRDSARELAEKIERLQAPLPGLRITIVGHSMGGLIALYYIKRLGGFRHVQRLITMGTPYQGTWAGLLGVATLGAVSRSVWQIIPGSDFLRDLMHDPLPPETRFYSIRALDDLLCPFDRAFLPGARDIVVPFGHASLVVSDIVYQKILESLSEP